MASEEKNATLWYACESCHRSIKSLSDFIEHKRKYHFKEFQNTECIIFQETKPLNKNNGLKSRTKAENGTFSLPKGPHTRSSVRNKKDRSPIVSFVTPSLKRKLKSCSGVNIASESNIKEPDPGPDLQAQDEAPLKNIAPSNSVIPIRTLKPGHKIQPLRNPYVLLKKLTTAEIKNLSSSFAATGQENKKIKTEKDEPKQINDTHDTQDMYYPDIIPKNEVPESFDESDSIFYPKVELLELDPSELRINFDTADKSEMFKCPLCFVEFLGKQLYLTHMTTSHPSSNKNLQKPSYDFKCYHVNCRRSFVNYSSLRDHYLTHSVFSCRFTNCFETFKTAEELKEHVQIHILNVAKSRPPPKIK